MTEVLLRTEIHPDLRAAGVCAVIAPADDEPYIIAMAWGDANQHRPFVSQANSQLKELDHAATRPQAE